MICVISKVLSNTGSNQLFILTGFFAVKNVGMLFQNMINIHMEVQGNQNFKTIQKYKSPKGIKFLETWNIIKLN